MQVGDTSGSENPSFEIELNFGLLDTKLSVSCSDDVQYISVSGALT